MRTNRVISEGALKETAESDGGTIDKSDVVISVEHLSKKFCRSLKRSLFYGAQDVMTEVLGLRQEAHKLRNKEFWALDNVSFQLQKGESLGLIGANGAGKTTLLRMISGLIKPDRGQITVRGRVAPLIALGAGFSPVLTGRENIYANMSILGLTKQEIDDRFEDVIAFAEIGEAIDAPLQTYSSGMAARLGFASAIHTEPDILLIDEVLAVGDMRFRAKCYRRLSKLKNNGTSFVMVSHSAHTIMAVCNVGMYLARGKVQVVGEMQQVMSQYEEDLFGIKSVQSSDRMDFKPKQINETSGLDILSLFFRDDNDNIIPSPITAQPASLCVKCLSHEQFENVNLALILKELADGSTILSLASLRDHQQLQLSKGECELRLYFPYVGLSPGLYSMKISVSKGSFDILDAVDSFVFKVGLEGNINKAANCQYYQPRSWGVTNLDI